ncbi:MAG: hypothetical protein QOD06_505 [Candidatus Binatota bacterium]|jgi:HSP20 family molecular chaperone IbpA|nr:hypothetical protein [Candidatus Binatota bacterium]
MPGAEEGSIDVNVANGVLEVQGAVSLKEYENLTAVYTEYNVGNWMRRFTLSSDIDTEKIQARMENGVLVVELPKAERAKPRKLTVKPA